MTPNAINIAEKFGQIAQFWTPKILAELNGQYVKAARLTGEFVWHSHEHEDELFMIIKGTLYIDFRDRTVTLNPGEMLVVPKGVEHCPHTNGEEVWTLLFEPKETKHTGEVETERTVKVLEWI